MLPRPRSLTTGPPVLPARLDAWSDRWWALSPRVRAAVCLVSVLVVVTAGALRGLTSPYGPPTQVLVATRDLSRGEGVDGTDLREATWPSGLVPTGATLVPDGDLTAPLPEGAVLTTGHLTEDGIGGAIEPGRAAVPVPVELVADLPVGTRVEVIVSDADGHGRTLAADAEVVAGDAVSRWISVDRDAAAEVAAAAVRGTLAIAVLPA
jgi:Flp pilus assembly protein CpaB